MRSILCIVFAFACGGSDQAKPAATHVSNTQSPASPAPAADPYGGATYGGVRYDHTAELERFHERISPLSGPASPKRRTAACAASTSLAQAAKALSKAARPTGADPVWDGEADELEAISEDLGTNCSAGDVAAIDFDIDSLHRSFARLMKLLPKDE